MKVILRENVENLGKTGDLVKVADGYARNYLIPRKLCFAADEKNLKTMEHYKKILEKKKAKEKLSILDLAKKLEAFSCTIARKVGENEKLFGSVTNTDITETLKKGGFEIDRHTIRLAEPIRQLGVHTVAVKLSAEVSAQLKVWVIQET